MQPTKPNQDCFLISKNLVRDNCHLFAVLDGHGHDGHCCSQFIAEDLPTSIAHMAVNSIRGFNPLTSSFNSLQRGLKRAFLKSDKNLTSEAFDTDYSGTTCVSVYVTPD